MKQASSKLYAALSTNAFEKHKQLIDRYLSWEKDQTLTDVDLIKKTHKFIRDDSEEPTNYEERLAVKYYKKLFKHYCLADLSRYKTGKIGLRWRTKKEVYEGKGQFICGSLACSKKDGLNSYEVLFRYKEEGELKQALVKCRLCSECANKMNYKHKRRKLKSSSLSSKKQKTISKTSPDALPLSEKHSSPIGEKSTDASSKPETLTPDLEGHWSKPQRKEEEKTDAQLQQEYFDLLL